MASYGGSSFLADEPSSRSLKFGCNEPGTKAAKCASNPVGETIDVWPQFRSPTDELTRTLRVGDLLGMDSGITEPAALSALHESDPTAPQLLQSIVNLPVGYPPGHTFFYNADCRWLQPFA